MGRPFFYLELNGMERDGTEQEQNGKKKEERERNDLAEGPHSRTEQSDFKKSRNVPSPTLDISNYEFCWIKWSKFKISKAYTIRLQSYSDEKI